MAFPQDPLAIRTEMQINSTWTNITSRVRGSDAITITGGFAPEQTSLTPSSINLTLNNRDGYFTDDYPASVNYGLLPTNTPLRVSTVETTPFLRLTNRVYANPPVNANFNYDHISTTDKASLDVTGDLDLRIEIEPDVWQLGNVGHHLAGKWYASGSQRSWAWVILPSGKMRLYWSSSGGNQGIYADSTLPVPAGSRIALRVTFDVDNGASGKTFTFYTSDSITGTWTQLGSPVIQAGTTAIFSGSANLIVGAVLDSDTSATFAKVDYQTDGPTLPLVGRVYRFQMYSGIGGTLVADMDATSRSEGDTSWSDGLASPNTWTLQRTAEISKADYRGYGEVSEMPQNFDISGTDFYVPASANGITRRLTQGASVLQSAIYRNLRQFINNGAVSYFPLEGGSQTVAAGNAVPRGPAARVNNVTFGADTALPGSAGVMTLNGADAYIRGDALPKAAADQAFWIWYMYVPSAPASTTELMHCYTSGTLRRITVSVGSSFWSIQAYGADGSAIGAPTATSWLSTETPPRWLAFQVKLTKNGTGVNLDLAWYAVGGAGFTGMSAVTYASSVVGAPTGLYSAAGAASMQAKLAHMMFGNLSGWEYATTTFAASSIGYDQERAYVRYLRLCREEGVPARCIGWPNDTEIMGPQTTDTLMNLLDGCVALEGGLHYEAKDQGALIIRTRASLFGQTALTLAYESGANNPLSGQFQPTQDDRLLRNRVTISTPRGTFGTYEKTSGTKSSASPPNGVGLYDVPFTRNSGTDARLQQLASWEVGKGTWPDRRVPNIEVWLQRSIFASNATLTRQMRSILPGSRLTITGVPVQLGGQTQDALIRGYRETLRNRGQEIAWSSVPYGPYDSGKWSDTNTLAADQMRYDVRTSTLSTSMSSSATLAEVSSSSRLGFWSWKSCPYTVKIAGQTNTVRGATRPDSISVVDTSFENGVTGYTASGGTSTFVASTAQKPFGTQSGLLTVAGSPVQATVTESTGGTAVASGAYQVKVWVRCSTSRNIGVFIDWYSSVPAYLSTSFTALAVVANTWTELTANFTAPASTANAKPGVYMDGSPANGTLLYVKNLDIMRIDAVNSRQLLLLTRGTPTKALAAGAEVHIYPQKPWALGAV